MLSLQAKLTCAAVCVLEALVVRAEAAEAGPRLLDESQHAGRAEGTGWAVRVGSAGG